MRAVAAAVAIAVLGVGCTAEDPVSTASAAPTPSPAVEPSPADEGPELAAVPSGDMGLWLTTIGVPVVAAVRTSTPLARLTGMDADDRVATCRQVARELDDIAPPQVLTGLAITADPETATLLTADLQAKAELLATCATGGAALDELLSEVVGTHAVAVAWLAALRDAS